MSFVRRLGPDRVDVLRVAAIDRLEVGGAIAAATLLALYVATGAVVFRLRRVERLLQGSAAVLIEDGRVRADVLCKFRISDDDLRTTLHQHGVLHVREVKRAFIEPDGEITLIKQADHAEAQPHLRREPPPLRDPLRH